MKHFFWGGEGGHGSGPPYEIAPEERGRHSPSTPLVMKVTSIVYNPPFQKFLDPPLQWVHLGQNQEALHRDLADALNSLPYLKATLILGFFSAEERAGRKRHQLVNWPTRLFAEVNVSS